MRQAFEQYALSDRPWPALIVNHRSHSTQFCKDSLPSMAASYNVSLEWSRLT
jgi:hypothetical protein